MSEKGPRPGQATFAAWLIIGGSVILVITAWQRISSLHTLEVQEELHRVLSEPPFAGTGLGVEGLKTLIRVLSMIGAATATASAILGVEALRRSTTARLVLTLLAPLVLVGGFAVESLFGPMVVAGVVMLWLRPTRDWFAGRPWVPATAPPASRRPDPFAPRSDAPEEAPAPAASTAPPASPASPAPPAPTEPSAAGEQPAPFPGRYGEPQPMTGPAGSAYVPRARRPGALTAACVIVWVSCALTAGFMLLLSLVMAVARDDFFAELERQQPDLNMQGMTHAELATGVFVMTGVTVVWCVVAVVLAVLAFRRMQWARIALVVNTAVTGLVLLAATLVNPALVVLLAAALVTLWLLLRADVTAWYAR